LAGVGERVELYFKFHIYSLMMMNDDDEIATKKKFSLQIPH
jgi:hypothetical protein